MAGCLASLNSVFRLIFKMRSNSFNTKLHQITLNNHIVEFSVYFNIVEPTYGEEIPFVAAIFTAFHTVMATLQVHHLPAVIGTSQD